MHMDRRYSLTVIGQRLCGTLAAGVIVVAAISCTRNPTRDKQRFFESGERYFRMNKCPEAVIQYRNALQVDPRYSEAYFRLGVCYASLERWSDAFNAWQETVQLDPSHIEAHLHLAELYLNSRDENNAEKQASIVLAQDRDNATAYQILGASLVAGGNKEDALRAFRQITKLRTQDPSAYTNSGLVEIGLGRLADAETDLRKAVDVDSSYLVGYINLANFYWLQGDLRTAEGVLREGAAHNPGSVPINVHLAENLHAQMKDDVSWAQQHLADGYVQGNSWGAWQTKDEVIKDYQNKTTKWKSGKISDLQVATYGPSTAVSRYKFTYDADFNGTHRARSVLCSDTWVNDSGTWKSAATHCSVANGK